MSFEDDDDFLFEDEIEEKGEAAPQDKPAISMPVRVVIDFLEGTSQKRDAAAFARGFIENHFDAPEVCGWFVMPYEGGYLYEVHEGGSRRAYAPAALKALQSDPEATVVIPMARRFLEVKRTHSGSYTSILLPEGMQPTTDNVIEAEPGPALKKYKSDGMVMFQTGIATFVIGFFALALTGLVFASGWLTSHPAFVNPQPPANLPLAQWSTATSRASATDFVRTMKFENGRWTFEQSRREVVDAQE